ncbi:tetratricopeptide repeat protein, partial [bacterium]|nr:tetratricopeptide repeat protein [bacterium]
DTAIYLYIAQNNFKLQDYQAAIDALDKAGEAATAKPQLLALRAECYWRLEQPEMALETLDKTTKKFPDYYAAYKQRFNYFIELELYQSAINDAKVYLANEEPKAKTYLSFIGALRKSGATEKATLLAEEANLKFVDDAEITVMLAHLYLDRDMIQAAANLFDEASIEDPKYTKEAAEMLRRAKEFTLALYKNAELTDTQEKYKQRVAIYLEFGEYERVVATHSALERSGLLEDENIRYALAYAYYMTSNFKDSEAQLKELTRPDLFQKATELRKNIEKCQNNSWECEL